MPIDSREVRGIPLWLIRTYLEEEGGRAEDDATIAGEGWRVRLTPIEDYRVGSLAVGQVRLDLDGDAEAVARLQEILDRKLLRAGG